MSEFQSCFDQCPVNRDQRWTPGRVLDFCDLVGVDAALPEYMAPYAALHRRRHEVKDDMEIEDAVTIYSVVTTIYASRITSAASTTVSGDVYSTTEVAPSETARVVTVTEIQSMSMSSASSETGMGSTSSQMGSGSSGLSTGAKAGIGVAVPVVVICAVLIALFYFNRRRKRKHGPENGGDEQGEGKEAVHPESKFPPVQFQSNLPSEIDGAPVNEFGNRPVERQRQQPVFELSVGTIREPKRNRSAQAEVSNVSEENGLNEMMAASSSTAGGPLPELPSPDFGGSHDGSSVVMNEQMSLSDLHEELARVARSKDRLQYLQSLEEREEQLRQLIASQRQVDASSIATHGSELNGRNV
ncbi:hypothetical protein BO70DRAFT_402175 [Aspergillus heteromorphus CBS 117.55]|uniref:Uncharacterized protein n=1 Tax=Aspergillus heteromorphus CBS 117.55 TaxID=1448321 RepID=A0A317X0W1_9EURO|nr:uncharacterized protein BO70DRAFT_402175 [Aspergillus heteromorphus CBS 117.55]PWY92284.1 hypothetical protein BO70DRAFT_402175 [Aspergillus heteromorphus CBS 117.55]